MNVTIDKKVLTDLLEVVEPLVGVARTASAGDTLEQLVRKLDRIRTLGDQCLKPVETLTQKLSQKQLNPAPASRPDGAQALVARLSGIPHCTRCGVRADALIISDYCNGELHEWDDS